MELYCPECETIFEAYVWGYGEMSSICPHCGEYLEDYSEHEKEQKERDRNLKSNGNERETNINIDNDITSDTDMYSIARQ